MIYSLFGWTSLRYENNRNHLYTQKSKKFNFTVGTHSNPMSRPDCTIVTYIYNWYNSDKISHSYTNFILFSIRLRWFVHHIPEGLCLCIIMYYIHGVFCRHSGAASIAFGALPDFIFKPRFFSLVRSFICFTSWLVSQIFQLFQFWQWAKHWPSWPPAVSHGKGIQIGYSGW